MRECSEIRLELLEWLQERLSPEEEARVEAHVARCAGCAGELDALSDAWCGLPELESLSPPASLRGKVLAYARANARVSDSLLGGVWKAVRAVAIPVAVGTGGAAVLVVLMHLRGAMAPLDHPTLVTLSLALAASIAAVAGGLWRSVTPRTVRAVLLGSVVALGGYLLLTVISPIPDTVQICRVALFRNVPMSLGEVCLVYLAVAVLYAGVPMGLAAYAGGAVGRTWRARLVEATIFALLAAPTVVLQVGVGEVVITLTVLAGLVAGSLIGGLGGNWVRSRHTLAATGS